MCGFRKNHITQYSLISLIEKWKLLQIKESMWAQFLWTSQKLLIQLVTIFSWQKLKAYGFSHNVLAFMINYLKNRSHRANINSNFSTREEVKAGVPQGSILGSLLFNIFINIFYFEDKSYLSNCADDNVLYAFGSNMTEVNNKLSQDLLKLSEWFTEYFMILNLQKCLYMCLGENVNNILKFCDETKIRQT